MPEPLLRGLVSGSSASTSVTVDGQTLAYADLLAAAAAVAERLSGRGRMAVHATPTVPTVVAVVGALLAGVEVVPVPPDAGTVEREHMLRDSGATAWLGTAPEATPLPVLPVDVRARTAYRGVAVDPARTALVLYTSGTTGPPKGVLISHRAIAAGLDALADAWAWTAQDVLAHGLPLFHVHGLVLGVLGALRVGCALVHVGRPTPAAYAAAGASLYFGVPTVWSRVATDPASAQGLRGARLLVSGSAALPVPVFDRLRELTGHEVAERYGMTETLITVAARADGPKRAGCVGYPLAGVTTRLRDEQDGPVPHDGQTLGRLQVRGPTLFEGYLGRPAETAAAWTEDGWFRTGDVAVVDPDGAHRIVGRESVDLIKSGGYRIGAGEIEAVLLGHPGVAECAVLGVADDDLGQRIVAVIVRGKPVAAEPVSGEQLTAYVAERLSAHKRPREVRFVGSLPRNDLGKVQKVRLLE
ncbi:MAG: acyl-CoA synthetase [Dermatophilaceae bacterium]